MPISLDNEDAILVRLAFEADGPHRNADLGHVWRMNLPRILKWEQRRPRPETSRNVRS